MPSFDLRNINIAEYQRKGTTVTYGTPESIGDAMSCNLELRFAEGRLYAESRLAEFVKRPPAARSLWPSNTSRRAPRA